MIESIIKISFLVKESFKLRREAKSLIESVKGKVENLIEKDIK